MNPNTSFVCYCMILSFLLIFNRHFLQSRLIILQTSLLTVQPFCSLKLTIYLNFNCADICTCLSRKFLFHRHHVDQTLGSVPPCQLQAKLVQQMTFLHFLTVLWCISFPSKTCLDHLE